MTHRQIQSATIFLLALSSIGQWLALIALQSDLLSLGRHTVDLAKQDVGMSGRMAVTEMRSRIATAGPAQPVDFGLLCDALDAGEDAIAPFKKEFDGRRVCMMCRVISVTPDEELQYRCRAIGRDPLRSPALGIALAEPPDDLLEKNSDAWAEGILDVRPNGFILEEATVTYLLGVTPEMREVKPRPTKTNLFARMRSR